MRWLSRTSVRLAAAWAVLCLASPAAAGDHWVASRAGALYNIRAPGHFDAVADFTALVADPAHPERLLPASDSGDHLHPSAAGQALLGAAVPLAVLGGSAR